MKGSRFTEEQIIRILREAEAGAQIREFSRRHGITDQIGRWNLIANMMIRDAAE